MIVPCYGIWEAFEELKYKNSMHTHSRWLNLQFWEDSDHAQMRTQTQGKSSKKRTTKWKKEEETSESETKYDRFIFILQ